MNSFCTAGSARWPLVLSLVGALAGTLNAQPPTTAAQPGSGLIFESELARLEIGPDGTVRQLVEKASGRNCVAAESPPPLASILLEGREHRASAAELRDGQVRLAFGASGVSVGLAVEPHTQYFVVRVKACEGPQPSELRFIDLPLTLKGLPDEPAAACVLALNLRTNVDPIPQAMTQLRATSYSRFGLVGGRAALLVCPRERLREVMKTAVLEAPALPHSNLGGPWALDAPINRGSYLFNFGGLNAASAEQWVTTAKRLGINQIDFHTGGSMRFGDLRPNPETYPRGLEDVKATVDALHAAGLAAGLHTYAFFLAKDSQWVTPVPDKRLAAFREFTLTEDLPEDATTLPVTEATDKITTITGFFEWNSVTLRIDDELITFGGATKAPPYQFTGCTRGAFGTKKAAHKAGAKAAHLKECFGLFVPDGESTLFAEVAARTAEVYSACGFDMIYLDALDGEGIVGGPEAGWHYGSKFVFEIAKRLNKPAVMEMSTFHHHLWYVRSRMGAWDHPNRGHKRFIDQHVKANSVLEQQFLPGHLGWWAVKTWVDIEHEPTYPDDNEYLCGKCLGHNVGLSVMGVDPSTIDAVPAFQQVAPLFRSYEELRRSGKVPDEVRAMLREPGAEFTMTGIAGKPGDKPGLQRVAYDRHLVSGLDNGTSEWTLQNPYGPQPAGIRIEAMMCSGPYSSPAAKVLTDFAEGQLPERAAAAGVTMSFGPATTQPAAPDGTAAATVVTLTNAGAAAKNASWAKAANRYEPTLSLDPTAVIGLWVHGDGRGEVLNLQVTSPQHLTRGIADHYIPIDFVGWRYFELIEPESERSEAWAWPYGGPYAMYREMVHYGKVETFSIWANGVAAGQSASVAVSPIKALPLVEAPLVNPAIRIGEQRIVFPGQVPTGGRLEYAAGGPGIVYGRKGEELARITPQGEAPLLAAGKNQVVFECTGPTDVRPRARVTLRAVGPTVWTEQP